MRLIHQIDSGAETLDVFSTVLRLRKDRQYMVQKPEQYAFLYGALAEYLRLSEVTRPAASNEGDQEAEYYAVNDNVEEDEPYYSVP